MPGSIAAPGRSKRCTPSVAARFSLAVSLDEFRRAWSSIFADDLNRTVADRLTQLASARFDVRICSNTNEPHWSGLRSKHPLLDALDQDQQCLLSFRIGKIKTDPGFFPHVATVTGLPVSDHLLIDDRHDNCQAAEAAGMRALQFRAGERGGSARIDDALRRSGWLAGRLNACGYSPPVRHNSSTYAAEAGLKTRGHERKRR